MTFHKPRRQSFELGVIELNHPNLQLVFIFETGFRVQKGTGVENPFLESKS